MIPCPDFYEWLLSAGVSFFTGVPDSLLKDFCAYLADHARDRHIVAANEGGAVALACGHHLASGTIPLVYMQNSGQGNAINPLLSLADPDVYSIPLLLLVGWRGEPGIKDEPQHVKQGKVTIPMMETLGIPCRLLPKDRDPAMACLTDVLELAKDRGGPVALLVQKATFCEYEGRERRPDTEYEMTREQAVQLVAENLRQTDVIVSTTGKASRELYEFRDQLDGDHRREFLTVGSMGHASQIAMGIALAKPDRQVFCLDGDGAVIMHMGSLAIIGAHDVPNLKHVVFNNGAHDSVGGLATVGLRVSFTEIARACCYREAWQVKTPKDVATGMADLRAAQGPAMLEILIRKGARPDLGRPKTSPRQNKAAFMEFLAQ